MAEKVYIPTDTPDALADPFDGAQVLYGTGDSSQSVTASGERTDVAAEVPSVLTAYIADVYKIDSLTTDAQKYLEGVLDDPELGADALQVLIEAHLRLVIHMAKSYWADGLELIDLIHEGNIGLLRGAYRFDRSKSKGASFTTHVSVWIRQSLSRVVGEQAEGGVHVPEYLLPDVTRLRRLRKSFEARHGRSPTAAEVEFELGTLREGAHDAAALSVVSLHRPVKGQSNGSTHQDEAPSELGEMIEAPSEVSDGESYNSPELEEALQCLTVLQRRVVIRHFGLLGFELPDDTVAIEELDPTSDNSMVTLRTALRKLKGILQLPGGSPEV